MNTTSWTPMRLAFGAGIVIACVVAAVWALRPIDHLASGYQQTTFLVECEYDKFKQIMVRKKATGAIIGQSEMTLVDEQLHTMQLDASNEDRLLLDAIRGKSKASLTAEKRITVKLNDPAINANQLVLRQYADIHPASMKVITKSTAPAGNLKNYETVLHAQPSNRATEVQLSVSLQVLVNVPKLFVSRANAEVQQSADDAVHEQAQSIKTFIARYADQRIILPELNMEP